MAYRLVLFACSWLFYKDECFLFCVLYALDTLQTYKQLTDSRKGQTENDLQRGLFFLNTSKVVQVLLSLPPCERVCGEGKKLLLGQYPTTEYIVQYKPASTRTWVFKRTYLAKICLLDPSIQGPVNGLKF